MTHKELKKILRKAGIGGMFGTGIRLFDTEYAEATLEDMTRRVFVVKSKIDATGLRWVDNISDCDNFSLWYHALMSMQWSIDHNGNLINRPAPNAPAIESRAYPFGRAHMKGHDTNIGVAGGKIYFWDYGELKYFDPKTIDEAEFK